MLHLTTADFRGVAGGLLRDPAVLSGLVVAAAGAAGLPSAEPPIVRPLPRDGMAILQLLAAGHIAVHTFPDAGVLTLDLLAPPDRDGGVAVEVFSRRLQPREVRRGTGQPRG